MKSLQSLPLLVVLVIASTQTTCLGLSATPQPRPQPRGCAATPLDKRQIAIFGAGGYLGATVFGFVQRASNLYGTGLGGASSQTSPRCIGATATAADSLNSYLSSAFKLAFAGESMVRLTDMNDVDGIARRLKGMDAAICGTVYQLERRPVTGNTYEKSPNEKAYEFYLDEKKTAGTDVSPEDVDVHLTMFRNTIDACKKAGLRHVVVLETPQTTAGGMDPKPFAEILDDGDVPFTYIHADGELGNCKDYTFEKGVQSDLDIESFTLADGYMFAPGYNPGDWMDSLMDSRSRAAGVGSSGSGGDGDEDGSGTVYREDVGALAVQSLMSLDWTKSRCMEVTTGGELLSPEGAADDGYARISRRRMARTDREWCVNSNLLAHKLTLMD